MIEQLKNLAQYCLEMYYAHYLDLTDNVANKYFDMWENTLDLIKQLEKEQLKNKENNNYDN